MGAAFDARTFLTIRADLSARLSSPVEAIALLDSNSNIVALDGGMADLIEEDADEALGKSQKWLLGRLGLSKKLEASALMAHAQPLGNGQEAHMSLTSEGLALCVSGEPDAGGSSRERPEPRSEFVSVALPTSNFTDLGVALGICNSLDEFREIVEVMAPSLMPGSSGTISLIHATQVFPVSSWGGANSLGFEAKDCIALRLGREFPSQNEHVPLRCKHGSSYCLPVHNGATIIGLVSFTGMVDRVLAEQFTQIIGSHARVLS